MRVVVQASRHTLRIGDKEVIASVHPYGITAVFAGKEFTARSLRLLCERIEEHLSTVQRQRQAKAARKAATAYPGTRATNLSPISVVGRDGRYRTEERAIVVLENGTRETLRAADVLRPVTEAEAAALRKLRAEREEIAERESRLGVSQTDALKELALPDVTAAFDAEQDALVAEVAGVKFSGAGPQEIQTAVETHFLAQHYPYAVVSGDHVRPTLDAGSCWFSRYFRSESEAAALVALRRQDQDLSRRHHDILRGLQFDLRVFD
jgi:hypothetical protein